MDFKRALQEIKHKKRSSRDAILGQGGSARSAPTTQVRARARTSPTAASALDSLSGLCCSSRLAATLISLLPRNAPLSEEGTTAKRVRGDHPQPRRARRTATRTRRGLRRAAAIRARQVLDMALRLLKPHRLQFHRAQRQPIVVGRRPSGNPSLSSTRQTPPALALEQGASRQLPPHRSRRRMTSPRWRVRRACELRARLRTSQRQPVPALHPHTRRPWRARRRSPRCYSEARGKAGAPTPRQLRRVWRPCRP